jgi:hypothetical protein
VKDAPLTPVERAIADAMIRAIVDELRQGHAASETAISKPATP